MIKKIEKIVDIYGYLYYRIYIWQKHINGEDSAPEIAARMLPTIMILGSLVVPILCVIDLLGIELNNAYIMITVFILFTIYYNQININQLENKYENETIFERKQRTKEMWILIGITIIWIIIFVLLITEPAVDSDTINRLRELRNS